MGKTGRENNPRPRRTGRGTEDAWSKLSSFEGGPVPINISGGEKTEHKFINPVGSNDDKPMAPKAVEFHAGPEISNSAVTENSEDNELHKYDDKTLEAVAQDLDPKNRKGGEIKDPENIDTATPIVTKEALPQRNGSSVEKREPKDIWESYLFHAAVSVRKEIEEMLNLIKEINTEEKLIKFKDETDNALKHRVLKARLYNPNVEEHLKKYDELAALENIDFESIKQEIFSDPKISELRDNKSKTNKEKNELDNLLKKRALHQIRDIFKNDVEIGEYARHLFSLKRAVDTKKVEIVDVPEEYRLVTPENEKPLKEQQREDYVRHILENKKDLNDLIYLSLGKKLIESRVFEVGNKLTKTGQTEKELSEYIKTLEPEKTDSFAELNIIIREKLGEIIARDHLGQFLANGQDMPKSTEKEVKIEEIFSQEQIEKMDQIVEVLKTNYLQELEEAKKWPGGWKGEKGQERAKKVIQDMKWASAREAYNTLVRNFKFALMHKDAGVDYMTKKIFEEK